MYSPASSRGSYRITTSSYHVPLTTAVGMQCGLALCRIASFSLLPCGGKDVIVIVHLVCFFQASNPSRTRTKHCTKLSRDSVRFSHPAGLSNDEVMFLTSRNR